MSTRFLIPIRKGYCLSTPSMMPQGLSSYCHPDDFSASMARIEAANTSPLLARLLYVFGWVGYVGGLVYIIGTPYYMQTRFWTSFSVLFISLAFVISIGRYMRIRCAEKVANAVAAEHANYSSRAQPLAWTVVRQGWYRHAVEVEVLISAQQLQIHTLQHQLAQAQRQVVSAQHHLQHDHAVIQQQAAVQAAEAQVISQQQQWINSQQAAAAAHAASPHYYPVVASPRPVYSPAAQSVFAHPTPTYVVAPAPSAPAVFPQDNIRTPLFYSQY